MSKDVILTVGITAHAEGILAHKTLQGVFAGLEKLDEKKFPYEIIIHIDNGDAATNEYFKRYEKDKKFTIIHSKFGDLGCSRNCIAKHAKGKYISFLDADDILSSNWYVKALDVMEKSKETIMVHPNVQFNFGAGTRLEYTMRADSLSKFDDAILLIGVNRWCSAIMGERETFLKYPYMETKNGYGYEDYYLNSNTVGNGIKHKVAPETVMFYRQKAEGSLLASSNSEKVIQPYISLFDIEYMKKISKDEVDRMNNKTRKTRRLGWTLNIYYKWRKNKLINYLMIPPKYIARRAFGIGDHEKEKMAKIPNFVIEAWKEINKIESQLYPTQQARKEIFEAVADDYSAGLAYYDLAQKIPTLPDQIFIVPWIRTGGADKVLVNYLQAIKKHHPEWKVAIITTEVGKNLENVLPDNAYVIDFGNRARTMWETQKEILFSRLMTQLKCKNIHIINSEYGYRWVASHKKFIAAERKLDVSIFSMTNQYMPWVGSYANPFLVDIYQVVNKIYSDNENMLNELAAREGFSKEKMEVVRQPIDIKRGVVLEHSGKKKILWASRVDHEKAPELLPKIMERLGADEYEIDMYGEIAEGYKIGMFRGVDGLRYCGKYAGMDDIDTEKYDIFLYTSLRDGMPNVILEIAAAGLPVVAPNVGGIPEFVQDKITGLIVEDIQDANEYATKIKYLGKHQDEAKKYVEEAQKVLGKQYSWKKFYEKTEEMFK